MLDEKQGQNNEDNKWNRPPRKSTIVRFLRALKRQYHQYTAEAEKQHADHERNEWLMAKWTRQVGIFTIILAFIASMSALISYLQWRTLEKSDENIRRTIEATQRPWLKIVEASVGKEVTFATDKPTDISVIFKLKNFGNGVASRIEGNAKLVMITEKDIPYVIRLNKIQQDICEDVSDRLQSSYSLASSTIFPADIQDVTVFANTEVVYPGNKKVNLVLIGCFTYVSEFSQHPYQTGFVYNLSVRKGYEQIEALRFLNQNVTFEPEAIALEKSPFGDFAR